MEPDVAILNGEVNKYNSSADLKEKSILINSIIQIKKQLGFDCYIEIKKYIKHKFELLETENYNYDFFNIDQFEKMISGISANKKIGLLHYAIVVSKKNGFENYAKDLNQLLLKNKFEALKEKSNWYLNPIKMLRVLLYHTSHNYLYLFFFIVIVYALELIIYLPTPIGIFQLFRNVQPIEKFSVYSHFFNVSSDFLEVCEKKHFEFTNFFGLIISFMIKILKIVVIIDFLMKDLIKKVIENE